jgi:hypothetical protein
LNESDSTPRVPTEKSKPCFAEDGSPGAAALAWSLFDPTFGVLAAEKTPEAKSSKKKLANEKWRVMSGKLLRKCEELKSERTYPVGDF